MLDIQFIRENREKVQKICQQKGAQVDVAELLAADEKRRKLLGEVEALRQKRNELTAKAKNTKPAPEDIEAGRKLKDELAKLENELTPVEENYKELFDAVPNDYPDDTPLGGEESNLPVRSWGEPDKREALDHLTWLEKKGFVDFERGAKVAGSKFYYSIGGLAELELALTQFAMDKARESGFTPVIVPNMVNARMIGGTGFAPKGEEQQIYTTDNGNLNLIATSEIPLAAMHADEAMDISELPILYVGYSPCYRMEAGSYGKHGKGLYRVHQFYKVEMYVLCEPKDSEVWHQKMVELEESICQELGIPYRVSRIAVGDLGGPAYKKFDIEYWSPVDGAYRELTSCSNTTDYQSQRLNIKYRDEGGDLQHPHTLNGTATVMSRFPIAIIENFQDENGDVKVPKVLQKYLNGRQVL